MKAKDRLKVVEQINVSSPCPISDFTGVAEKTETGWNCSHCSKAVYDLKVLSKSEISGIIDSTGGNFCAIVSRRKDGSLITRDSSQVAWAAGVLIASSVILTSPVAAQVERGDVAIEVPHEIAAGGIKLDPSLVSSAASEPGTGSERAGQATPPAEKEAESPAPRRGRVMIKTPLSGPSSQE